MGPNTNSGTRTHKKPLKILSINSGINGDLYAQNAGRVVREMEKSSSLDVLKTDKPSSPLWHPHFLIFCLKISKFQSPISTMCHKNRILCLIMAECSFVQEIQAFLRGLKLASASLYLPHSAYLRQVNFAVSKSRMPSTVSLSRPNCDFVKEHERLSTNLIVL